MKSKYTAGQSVTVRNLDSRDCGKFGRIKYIDQAGRYWVLLYGKREPHPFHEKELILTRDTVSREVSLCR